jgi:PD-(D/E)XK nuclease superfamily protein
VTNLPCRPTGVVSISGIARWADAVIALDARGALPARVVLVPSEAHAHALRVELVTRGPRALAGTWFFTIAAAARAVLDNVGIAYRIGEEVRRPLRLRKVFRARPALATYRIDDMHTTGWEDAFASTIEQLESAALRPADLERLGEPRARDLAAVWRAVDDDAGMSWTVPRLMAEAHGVLAATPGAWPFDAPVLAAAPIGIDAAHARLLHVIPRLTLGIIAGRPTRRAALDRMRGLLGDAAAELVASAPDLTSDRGELGVLTEHLFEAPERLAAARRRSRGPDGTVSLELHSGADDEIEAAARWVADEVFHHQTPLRDIAILVPTPDPLASLIAARIEALPWPSGTRPVYLACGRPAVSTAAGARLLAIVRAWGAYLPADAMIEILPRLRLGGVEGHLSPGRARTLVAKLGTIGGSATRPEDARRWSERLARTELDDATRAVAPALEALVAVAAAMIDGASLGQLWRLIRTFVATHLIAPRELAAILEQLDGDVCSLASDAVTAQVVGVEAMELVTSTLCAIRLDIGRHGEPAIYVGTVTGAAGLPFAAVRVLGLVEGAYPGTLRADAILPPHLRDRLPPHTAVGDDDFATGRLHALDQVVRGVTQRLSVSAPRTDFDGSEREPAALFVEMAAALARPNAITGEPARLIPNIAALERDAFRAARTAAATRRAQAPLTPSYWLDGVASGVRQAPSAWSHAVVTSPGAIAERAATMHGELGSSPLTVTAPGGAPDHPLSASALRVLLACPQRFLLERLLGFWCRTGGVSTHRIDPASYGTLFHEVAAGFSRTYGLEFGARERDLAHWLDVGDRAACTAFDLFLGEYPLNGDGAAGVERRRLRRDVRTFIEDDWDGGRPRRFVAAERVFGEDVPVWISTTAGRLFVAGRIDRVDVEGSVTVVRDLKTGRARPRERDRSEPDVNLDLQLGVYAAVAEHLAAAWSTPADVAAAYLYVDHLAADRERSFRADRQALRAAAAGWFDLAMSLIRDQRYTQTPDANDCRICPFSAVCGDDTVATNERLREATGSLAVFRDLKS